MRQGVGNRGFWGRLFSVVLLSVVGGSGAAQATLTQTGTVSSEASLPIALEIQREQYRRALSKLQAGDRPAFEQLRQQLNDYPLQRYLQYADLKSRRAQLSQADIDRFSRRYPDSYLNHYLRGIWLHELARRGQWQAFLDVYDNRSDKTLACYSLQAQIKLEHLAHGALLRLVEAAWLQGDSQPKACDPAFAWFKAQGGMSPEVIWRRTALALDKRNWKLAAYLAKKLKGTAYARQYRAWRDVRRRPEIVLERDFVRANADNSPLILYAANLVLSRDLVEAEALWKQLQTLYTLDSQVAGGFTRRLAIRSAQRHYDDALVRLAALPDALVDGNVRAWRVRAALRQQDWIEAYRYLLSMSAEEQARDEWVYWRGRAEQELGNSHIASLAYQRLAKKRGYYSFLAAERLEQPYVFTPRLIPVEYRQIQSLAARDDFRRVRELLEQDQLNYARVEWRNSISALDESGLAAAGRLAHQWQWHEMAIRVAAKLGHYDDLDLRFAMPHREAIEHYSQRVNIDPNWAQAIMRRESAYAADARSGVGARGLMQIMPTTARHVAKKQHWKWLGVNKLNEPEHNIRYGTAYLAELSERFVGQVPLVTAAYNAGPHRVDKWLPKDGALPMDIWIETIPFEETRKYVRAVSEYMSIFNWRQQGKPIQTARPLHYTQKRVGESLVATNGDNTLP